jgi:hypothetical protein
MPGGLALDSFRGSIRGAPTTRGAYTFDVEVRDSLGAALRLQRVSINVR